MAFTNSYVQLQADGSGKKIQNFQNDIDGQTVHAQATVLVDPLGNPIATQPTLFTNIGDNAAVNISTVAAVVLSFSCHNKQESDTAYAMLFNNDSAPTLGNVPLLIFAIPPLAQIIVGTDFFSENGIVFSDGLSFGFSSTPNAFTEAGDSDQSSFVVYKEL